MSERQYPDGYAIAPNWVIRNPDFPPMAKLLYVYLESRANRDGIAWPGQKLISEELGVSVSTVERAVRWLKENDLIEVEARKTKAGRANTYRMTRVLPLSLTGWGSPHDEGGSRLTEGMGPVSQRAEEVPVEEEPLKNNTSTSLSSNTCEPGLVELKQRAEREIQEQKTARVRAEELESIKASLSERARTETPIPLSRRMNPTQLGYTLEMFSLDFPGLVYTDVLELFRTHYISKGDKSNNWFEKFLMFADGAQRRRKENIRASGGTETDSMGLPVDPAKRRAFAEGQRSTYGSRFREAMDRYQNMNYDFREARLMAIEELEGPEARRAEEEQEEQP